LQTFLPYPDFYHSAFVLDPRRLGKQRVEAKQILDVLANGNAHWEFHPAVRMWRGYEPALILYMDVMIVEWQRRGYANTMPIVMTTLDPPLPPWMGEEAFHLSHQSNLLRKDWEYYRYSFPGVLPTMPYIWPR
jgi:hypothetical protein